MAKDNAQGVGVQYKVLLKPNEVGLLVMKRMERPHLDKSAELRRLVELGYAAEQAGFILDGTVLRHAGRAWETQPDFSTQAIPGLAPALPAAPKRVAGPYQADQKEQGDAAAPTNNVDSRPDSVDADAPTVRGSPLRGNLRRLSGRS